MDKSQAAGRLGVPEVEVVDVRDTPHGPVAATADGREYLIGDEQVAFWLEGPKGTTFPVFAPPSEDDAPAEVADGAAKPSKRRGTADKGA